MKHIKAHTPSLEEQEFISFLENLSGSTLTLASGKSVVDTTAEIFGSYAVNMAFDTGGEGAKASGGVQTVDTKKHTVTFTAEQLLSLARAAFREGASWSEDGQEPYRPEREMTGVIDLTPLIEADNQVRATTTGC